MVKKPEHVSPPFTLGDQLRRDWPLLILMTVTLIAAFWLYPQLPQKVPSHWNWRGEVDGYSGRFWGAFGLPLLCIGLYVLMLVLPYLDPRRDNYGRFAGPYGFLKAMMVCFFIGLYVVTILAALGNEVAVDRLVPLGVSLLIIGIGTMLGKVQHNYFVGIKVPWTLASEEVWRKTHRMAGPMWVAAGCFGVVGAIWGGRAAIWLFFVPLGLALIIPTVYSFLLYRRLHP